MAVWAGQTPQESHESLWGCRDTWTDNHRSSHGKEKAIDECAHLMRSFAKSHLLTVESLVLACYSRLPDPGGETRRNERLSSTHRSKIGWDSAFNAVAILSAALQ